MEGELIITKHYANGQIEVEHRKCGALLATYVGYPRGERYFRLYPQKGYYHRDVRLYGRIVSLFDMKINMAGRKEAPAPLPQQEPEKKKKEKIVQVKEGKQTSIFDLNLA